MPAATHPIVGFLNGRLDVLAAGHRDADLFTQIPREMLHHLLRQGFYRLLATIFLPVPIVFFLDRAVATSIFDSYQVMDASTYFVFGILFLAVALDWKRVVRGPLNREVIYRRLHGKWRWER